MNPEYIARAAREVSPLLLCSPNYVILSSYLITRVLAILDGHLRSTRIGQKELHENSYHQHEIIEARLHCIGRQSQSHIELCTAIACTLRKASSGCVSKTCS